MITLIACAIVGLASATLSGAIAHENGYMKGREDMGRNGCIHPDN